MNILLEALKELRETETIVEEIDKESLNERYSRGSVDFCTPVKFKQTYTYNGVEYEVEGSCMVSGTVSAVRTYYSPATYWEPEESETELGNVEEIDEIKDVEIESIHRVGEEDPDEDLDAIADAIENELADDLEIDVSELEIDDNDVYWDHLKVDEPDYDDYGD